MKIPSKIVTRNKIRDAAICSMYARNSSTEEIALHFGISQTQVNRLIYANRHVFVIDRDYEKLKRIHFLNRRFVKYEDNLNAELMLYDRIKVEIDGNKPLVDNSQHITNIIYTRKKIGSDDRDSVRSTELSRTNS